MEHLPTKVVEYLLDKYRDELQEDDNERRRALKALACQFCFADKDKNCNCPQRDSEHQ